MCSVVRHILYSHPFWRWTFYKNPQWQIARVVGDSSLYLSDEQLLDDLCRIRSYSCSCCNVVLVGSSQALPKMNFFALSVSSVFIRCEVETKYKPSVTSGTKGAGNVENSATSNAQERISTPPHDERRRNPIWLPLRWMMNAMIVA